MTETTSTPTAEQPSATAAPENPYAAPRTESSAPASATNGFSIASLVLGIASIPTGWAIAGILAIVFGFLARSREPQGRTMSTWGIVLGFVGTFGWLVVAILGFAIAAPFALWGMGFGWGPDFFDVF
jgi:F0F1-type ATP synthase membrane subunit c/vacuolar-type H+-ATPase subunit K